MLHNKSNDYLNYVDGLRAFAVLVVLFFHLNCTPFAGGFIGVDVFFVISGFLITRLIIKEIEQTGTFSFVNFYYRRVRRIIPALFFVLCCTGLAAIVLFSPGHLRALGSSIAAAALSVSNIYFWRQSGYFDAAAEYKPLLHTWSLGVEEQFYFVWPFILFFMAAKFHKKYLIWTVILFALMSLGANLLLQKSRLSALYYLMPFRFFEFCIGAAMVWGIKYRPKRTVVMESACFLGLGLMLYAVIAFNKNTIFPSYNALIPTVGAALVIYAGNTRYMGWLFSNRVAVALGLISYSLYLVHWPIIVFYSYVLNAPISSWQSQSVVLALSLLMATAMYYFIEQPFRRGANSEHKAQFLLIYKWMPGIAFVACLGVLFNFSHGLLWRIPQLKQLPFHPEELAQDYHKTHFGGQGFSYPFGWTYQTQKDAPDVVLLGDSHAQMLQYGITHEIAKIYNKSVYMAGSSCLILPGLSRTTPGDDWDSICPNVLKQGLSQLNKKSDSILILSQAWLFQILKAKDTAKNQIWAFHLNDAKHNDFQPLMVKLAELRQVIGERTLIIIGDVPGAGVSDPFSCITRPALARAHCMKQLDTSLQSHKDARRVNRMLRDFTKKNQHTYFLDPYKIFCTNTLCRSLNERGEPYYSDADHLSEIGSQHLMSQLKPQIVPLILQQST